MSFFINNNAIGSSTSRSAGNRGQNSLRLDKISAYFRRKLSTKSIKTTATTPQNKINNVDKTIEVKNDKLRDNNQFLCLIDELDDYKADITTGFVDKIVTTTEKNFNNSNDIKNTKDIATEKEELSQFAKRMHGIRPNLSVSDSVNRKKSSSTNDLSSRSIEHKTEDSSSSVQVLKKKIRYQKDPSEISSEAVSSFNDRIRKEFPEFINLLKKDPINGMYDITPLKNLGFSDRFDIKPSGFASTQVVENDMQTDNIGIGVNIEQSPLSMNNELFKIPKRKFINKIIKDKKYYKAHSRLVSYLRCKTFLKHRDTSLIQQLVHMANIWMVTEKYLLDDPLHYTVIASAVTVAFMISEEELMFREAIKNKTNWDNMRHLNATISGDLGKVFRLPGDRFLNEDNPAHKVMDNLLLKPNPLVI